MLRPLNTFVVTGDPVSLAEICERITQRKELQLTAQFSDDIAAAAALLDNNVELVFLDMELLHSGNKAILSAFDDKTQLVLLSDKSEDALQAFEYGAVDFLLKPLVAGRFEKTVQRLLKNRQFPTTGEKTDGFLLLEDRAIQHSTIQWIEAYGDYMRIVTDNERVLVLSTMKAIYEKLPAANFLRIHRSYIVNLNRIDNYTGTAVEIQGQSLPMSRKHRPELEELLAPV